MKDLTPLILLLLSALLSAWAHAETRIALVIGNSNYSFSPLTNPVNDATDMAETLKELGFNVFIHTDLDRKQMRQVIRKFGEKLKKSDVGLFYYAGHGIQIKGKNFLVPISADVTSADEVEDESIDASSVLRKMETAGNPVNILILDACRNNPFARSFRSAEQGLARMDGPVGSLIAYATSPGSVAADGSGKNGLYTKYLLEALQQPGLTIEQTFKRVRNNVRKDTDGRQIPWESSSLTGEFVFRSSAQQSITKPPPPPPPPPPLLPPVERDKYLQIVTNIPEAEVVVNNIFRGITNQNGVLNIGGLSDNEAVVMVKASGYEPKKQKIKLLPGQWKQVSVDLQPGTSIMARQSPAITTQHACLAPGRILLLNQLMFVPLHAKPRHSSNNPGLFALLQNQVKKYRLDLVEIESQNHSPLFRKIRTASPSFYQKMGRRSDAKYLLKMFFRGREIPIKAVKTHMKTLYGEILLELRDLQTGLILATVSREFKKPGMDMQVTINEGVRQYLEPLLTQLFSRACQG